MPLPQDIQDARKLIRPTGRLYPFLPLAQRTTLLYNLTGEEGSFFAKRLQTMAERIEGMPVSYEQDGKGDEAVAYLHYFNSDSDFWITEKDMGGEVEQAFGLTCTTGNWDDARMGYISIAEITKGGVELDLFWDPKTLSQIKNTAAEFRERFRSKPPSDDGPCP